tara:strand:- start:9540 stop:14534 length:4995 start_codon:yes stop_codon:yes gene_type:complete
MTVINLGNLKFTWKGNWAPTTAYKKDDIVKYGPSVYVCIDAHTSASVFADNVAKFEVMSEGLENSGVWSQSTLYKKGQTVTYGGAVYIALQESTNQNPYSETVYWQRFVDGQQFEGDWNSGTNYQKGDIVYYGGYLYVAKQNTVLNNPTNTTFWDVYVKGYSFIGNYSDGVQYKPGDVVLYGGNRYVAQENKRPLGVRPTDVTTWQQILSGFTWKGAWLSAVQYLPGEIVKYGSYVYLCTSEIKGQRPDQTNNFTLFTTGLTYKGVWSSSTDYSLGDIAKLGGRTYICIESYENDGSTSTEPPNSSYWEVFTEGFNWRSAWDIATEYEYGDVVEYAQSSYVSIAHDNVGTTPGTDVNVWQLMAQGDSNAVLTTKGDIIYRDATQVTRLPVGPSGSFLTVKDGEPTWGHLTPQNDYYVSPQGDDTNDGRTPTTSWKTIRHAADQTFSLGQCRINVQAGTYTEQCPIKVGRSVVLEGNGLGAVTVSPDTTNDNGFGVGISDDGSTPNANSEAFHMNNGCRMRNFVFRNFSTGSVIVSLDPGTGPDDTSVWITSQSPYVQNCTSFTPGGTGFKIDGGLHNGGYKSMVANDWTQINSDGIGVHVLNDGRTEIVSCFTYYCNNGYLAESGGKIRAIVGNNSYGEYGAVARGFSQSEAPLTGKLRLNNTTIDSVTQIASNVHTFTSYRDSIGARVFVGHTNPTATNVTSSWSNTASYPFITKYNAAGSLDWIYTYESSYGAIHSVVELSDKYYAGGVIYDGGTNKGLLLCISKAGEIQWQKIVGNTSEITAVTTDTNNLYAVGTHTTSGMTVIKVNPAGVEDWARALEYNDSSAANTIVPTSCTFAVKPTTSTDTYAGSGDATAENNLYIAAYDSTANQSVVTRIDLSGNYVASYIYGDVRINSINLDPGSGDGIYLIAAGYYDAGAVNKNPLIFRLSVDGDVVWQKQYSLSSEEGEFKDVIAQGNDVYAVGYINEGTNNNNTGLITRISSNGNTIPWAIKFDNGTNNIALNGIMLDGVNVIAAGIEQGNSVIVNIQRDNVGGLGTVTSGSYAVANSTSGQTSNTVVTKGIEPITQIGVVLGLTDTNLTLNQSPSQTRTAVATRSGFAGIGRGTSFAVDSLNRLPKDGSVLQIQDDTETYFVISVTNYVGPSFTTGNNPNAQAILLANKTFLQKEITAWIDIQIAGGAGIWAGFTYDAATCERDVGLVIDALKTDLDENSNGKTIDAAYSYWNSASGLYSVNAQKQQNVATWTYFKSIVDDVISQSVITKSTGNAETQVTGLSATESGTVTLTENNVQAFIDTLDGGLNNTPAKINYGTCTIGLDPAIPSNKTPNDLTHLAFREAYSQVRMSGHDFLDIGTGGFADTNYPVIISSDYTQQPSQDRETLSENGGRVFYVTTDQDGNFRVGDYFKVEQATGRATLSSEEFDLAGLNELQLGSITAGKQGATINEFSTDGTFADNSDTAVPTEKATKTYVDQQISNASSTQSTIVAGNSPTQSKVEVTGSGSATDTIDFDINGNEVSKIASQYILVPKGDEASRPGSPVAGYLRFNTDTNTFEGYDGTQWSGIGGGNPWAVVNTTPYTASNNDRLFVDTTSAVIIINLPTSPAVGDNVRIMDLSGTFDTNACTVDPGTKKINGVVDTLSVTTENAGFQLVYTGATNGWKLLEV